MTWIQKHPTLSGILAGLLAAVALLLAHRLSERVYEMLEVFLVLLTIIICFANAVMSESGRDYDTHLRRWFTYHTNGETWFMGFSSGYVCTTLVVFVGGMIVYLLR